MPGIARVVVPDIPDHITQRGNRRQVTFFCDDDYRAYVGSMGRGSYGFFGTEAVMVLNF